MKIYQVFYCIAAHAYLKFNVHMIGVLHIYRNEDTIQHNNSMCIYQIQLVSYS